MKSEIVDNKRSTIVIHKVLFDNEKEAPIAFLDSKFALSIKIGKGATSTVLEQNQILLQNLRSKHQKSLLL